MLLGPRRCKLGHAGVHRAQGRGGILPQAAHVPTLVALDARAWAPGRVRPGAAVQAHMHGRRRRGARGRGKPLKHSSATGRSSCPAAQNMSQIGEQRQQAQLRRQPLRPLVAAETPGRELPQAQELRRRQLRARARVTLAAATPAAWTRGMAAAVSVVVTTGLSDSVGQQSQQGLWQACAPQQPV